MKTETLLALILEVAEELHAKDIKVLQIGELCSFADFFVIMSGNSSTQVKALGEELVLRGKRAKWPANHVEGLAQGEWVLLDFGDIVTHIFHPDSRAFYDLDNLWKDAPILEGPATTEG